MIKSTVKNDGVSVHISCNGIENLLHEATTILTCVVESVYQNCSKTDAFACFATIVHVAALELYERTGEDFRSVIDVISDLTEEDDAFEDDAEILPHFVVGDDDLKRFMKEGGLLF